MRRIKFVFAALFACAVFCGVFSASAATLPNDLSVPFENTQEGVYWDPSARVLVLDGADLKIGADVVFPDEMTLEVRRESRIKGSMRVAGTVTVRGNADLYWESSSPVFPSARVNAPSYVIADSAGGAVGDVSGRTSLWFRRLYTVTLEAEQEYEYYVGDFSISTGSDPLDPGKSVRALPGTQINVSFSPREGFLFDEWKFEGADPGISDVKEPTIRFTMPARDLRLRADTTPIEYHFTIQSSGGGTVEIEGREPENGRYPFYVTDHISVSAVPTENHLFVAWSATDGAVVSDPLAEDTTITVPACDFVLRVQFATSIRKLTIDFSEGGTTIPGPGVYDYGVDSILELEAVAEEGWTFSNWECSEKDGIFSAPQSPRTSFTMPDHNCTVTAVFLKGGYRLSAGAGIGGRAVVPEGVYEMGVTVPVRAEPDEGYRFLRWEVTPGGAMADPTQAETQIVMPAQSVTLRAVFVLDTGVPIASSSEDPVPGAEDPDDPGAGFPWVAVAAAVVVTGLILFFIILRDRTGLSIRYLVFDRLLGRLFRKK